MSLLVYQNGDGIYINAHLIPDHLMPYLHLLTAELDKQFSKDKLTTSMVPAIDAAASQWIKKYRYKPPVSGGQITMPEVKVKAQAPEPEAPAKSAGGFVVEVRCFIDGKTQLKRYSCLGFTDLDEAIAHTEEHPDVKPLIDKRLKGFHDEHMKAGDKRRTYITKGVS